MIATVILEYLLPLSLPKTIQTPTQIMYPPEPACTSDIFQSKQKSVAIQAHKKLTKQDDKRVIKRKHRRERPRTAASVAAERNLPPECIIKSLSILPGMALHRRMPPTDILGSYQNPCMESPSRKTGQIRESK